MPRRKQCAQCGIWFMIKPSHYDKKVYCSKACMAEGYKKRMCGENNPNYRGAGKKTCAQCGQAFTSYTNKIFCSLGCYNASDLKREHARRANNSRRRPHGICKHCGGVAKRGYAYCSECWATIGKKREGKCLNCGQAVRSNYDVQFCKDCRVKELHKKEVFSICSRCGIKIPDRRYRKYCDFCWRQTVRLGRDVPRKKDANQNEIVEALEKAGCSVIDASAIGGGFPDLIVGRAGITYLIEVKNPKTKGKLNALQQRFFDMWTGHAAVAYTSEEALAIVGLL